MSASDARPPGTAAGGEETARRTEDAPPPSLRSVRPPVTPHIARWDLDKTYLRTEFDSLKDLVRTAFERPDEKRANPGAPTMLRELTRAGSQIHILSGSPEQMRSSLERKLKLDGVAWASFVLKPNLQNLLRFRFRALRDQLGYKLPALLQARVSGIARGGAEGAFVREAKESLFGDDAEADAFVYALYGDLVAGRIGPAVIGEVLARGRLYEDVASTTLALARALPPHDPVERILIHLEGQSDPAVFDRYGGRVVPFYNYLQAAFVLFEDGRLDASAVLRIGGELVREHRFDGSRLARSYQELAQRGHVSGVRLSLLAEAYDAAAAAGEPIATPDMLRFTTDVQRFASLAADRGADRRSRGTFIPNYVDLVLHHNKRRTKPR